MRRLAFLALGLALGVIVTFALMRDRDAGSNAAALPDEQVLSALIAQGADTVEDDSCPAKGTSGAQPTVATVLAHLLHKAETGGALRLDCDAQGQCSLALSTEGPERDKGTGVALRWKTNDAGAIDPMSLTCLGY